MIFKSITTSALASISLASEASIETIIVTASRLPQNINDANYSADFFDTEAIKNRQQNRLQDALNLSPGILSTSTRGQEGNIGTLIIRGLPSSYNQVLIDGVRISDAIGQGLYLNVLGNFQFSQGESLEVIKGSQSVVHGGSSIGGLVGLKTDFETSSPTFSISQELGSFERTNTSVHSHGSTEDLDFYVDANSTYFEQDGDINQSSNQQFSAGIQQQLSDSQQLIITARNFTSDLENNTTLVETGANIFTVKLNQQSGDYIGSSVLAYISSENVYNTTGYSNTQTNEKWSLTSDHQYQANETFTINLGADISHNNFDTETTSAGLPAYGIPASTEKKLTSWETYGIYLNSSLIKNVFFSELGFRAEFPSNYDFTPSAHASLGVREENLYSSQLRLSYSNRTPSLLDTEEFYDSNGLRQTGTEDLSEENVISIEVNNTIHLNDSFIFKSNAYANFISNAINNPSGSTAASTNNAGTTEIIGLETSAQSSIDKLNLICTWNYSAKNELTNNHIPFIPRNTINADINYDNEQWLVGFGAQYQTRASFGADGSFGPGSIDARTVCRIYGHYHLNDYLTLTGRVENLFDEQYNLNPFGDTPGRGTAAFAGLKLSF